MTQQSAGLLMYRLHQNRIEVFLVHPGGPFFARRDDGVWTLPKGEPENRESLEETARREFFEETGITPAASLTRLGSIRQKGGKTVHAWAFAGDWNEADGLPSNTFELQWPPRSGIKRSFPEVDRAAFFPLSQARAKINPAQIPFIDTLEQILHP